jgi:hypothetical protein
MKNILHGSLVMAISFAAFLPAMADETTTTIQTAQPAPLAAPQVIDSYMKPTVTETKSVTTTDGNTQTSTAPLIMERHERVAVPTSEVVNTTTTVTPKVTTETYVSSRKKVAVAQHRVVRKVRRPVVAHRVYRPRTVAVNVRKVTTVQPQVIQQTQTIEHKGVIIDRPDPALNQ